MADNPRRIVGPNYNPNDPEQRSATGLEDPFSKEGLGIALKALYHLAFGSTAEEQLAGGLMGNVTIPQASRAREILAKKLPEVFSNKELAAHEFPAYRYQYEQPGQETLRRGGEYYLVNKGKGIENKQYASSPTSLNMEGGHILKEVSAQVSNPLLNLSNLTNNPGRSTLRMLIGDKESGRISRLAGTYTNDPTSLKDFLRVGATVPELKLAMEARAPKDALMDLYKAKLLDKYGYDSVIRHRGVGTGDEPEAFLLKPKEQAKVTGVGEYEESTSNVPAKIYPETGAITAAGEAMTFWDKIKTMLPKATGNQ